MNDPLKQLTMYFHLLFKVLLTVEEVLQTMYETKYILKLKFLTVSNQAGAPLGGWHG